MIIHRINSALLEAVGQWAHRYHYVQKSHAEHNRELYEQERDKLVSIQEANRLLRNYNYQKDTEEIRNAEFYESIKEQRLLARSTVRGVFLDRYV